MKLLKITLSILAILMFSNVFAQDIKLPEPDKTGGKPLMQT